MATASDAMEIKKILRTRFLPNAGRRPSPFSTASVTDRRSIHAIGLRRDRDDGAASGASVRVYVEQKAPKSALAPDEVVPSQLDGISIDVVQAPRAVMNAGGPVGNLSHSQRPIVAGISTGHCSVSAGTIGYFCRSTDPLDHPDRIYVLSNMHILAPHGACKIRDAIYQPGPRDGGDSTCGIAELHRYETLQLNGPLNAIDAAIGALLDDIDWKPELCSIGRINQAGVASANMRIRLHGRTTGYTEGTITEDSLDAEVDMVAGSQTHVTYFENQLLLRPDAPYTEIGTAGNSGSLVVARDEPTAVGLLFAGSTDGSLALANPIGEVLTRLKIALV
jgi:hypothetical protein